MTLPPPRPSGDHVPPGYQAPAGYQPYGAQRAQEHPKGTTILVLGILSLVVCGVLGPIAWVMGNRAVREMDSTPGVAWSNRGNVTAGRICGMIGSAFMTLTAIFMVVAIGMILSSSS